MILYLYHSIQIQVVFFNYFELTLESRAAKEFPYELTSMHLVDRWMVHWTRAFFSMLPDVALIDAIADFVAVAGVAVAVVLNQMETSAGA